MRRFRIDEISGVDWPCQSAAKAVIFKRGSPPQEPGLEGAQQPAATDWTNRRTTALQSLQKLAEDRAAAKGETVPTAYAAIMATPEGAELYQRAS